MNKIEQLKDVKAALRGAGKEVRAGIRQICDEDSFVELSALRFSREQILGDTEGEGVVTGFATIGGYPFYFIAQNFESNFGALTQANCDKIARALDAAEKAQAPVVYLLRSQGAKIQACVGVLGGLVQFIRKAAQFKGTLPQYAVVVGEVYGSAAALASMCDVVFFLKESALALTSPFVLSAKAGKSLKREEVGGYDSLGRAGLPAMEVASLQEAAGHILAITELLNEPMIDADLNTSVPALNDGAAASSVLEGAVELGANACPEVRTMLGRVGGISVAAVQLTGGHLNALSVRKVRDFAEFASCYDLPFVTFVDCEGFEETMDSNNSLLMKEIGEYMGMLDNIGAAKISVVTGQASGLCYALFASKSAGFDYSFAFASAQIALFDGARNAEIVSAAQAPEARAEAAENAQADANPVWAAQNGYLDDIIEPQFLRQYLIASLQMLMR